LVLANWKNILLRAWWKTNLTFAKSLGRSAVMAPPYKAVLAYVVGMMNVTLALLWWIPERGRRINGHFEASQVVGMHVGSLQEFHGMQL